MRIARRRPFCPYCSEPEPLHFRSLLVLATYVGFFGLAIRLFFIGRHALAWIVIFGIFLVLAGYVLRESV
jgi:hypothetical protein